MHSTGIQADYAGRMAEAVRIAPRHQIAAILQGLRAELAQALAAVAAAAQAETRARQNAAIAARSGGRPPSSSAPATVSDADEGPGRPEVVAHTPRRELGR